MNLKKLIKINLNSFTRLTRNKTYNFFFIVFILTNHFICSHNRVTRISYPEKFEGLTQLILASETKILSFTDTTVQKVLGFKLGSAQVKVTSSVTFDFYLDFQQDDYTMSFNQTGDTLVFKAPSLRVKKPVINSSQVSFPEKSFLINEQEAAIQKLEKLTDEFVDEGADLLTKDYVINKCREMLEKHLLSLCKKLDFPVIKVIIIFPSEDNSRQVVQPLTITN